MASDTRPEMLEMDTSDVDLWIGVPLGGQQFKEPFSVNDIRRFVQGMQNPNPLHYDEEYAAQSHFGGIVAPQSYFGGGPGTGATPWASARGGYGSICHGTMCSPHRPRNTTGLCSTTL